MKPDFWTGFALEFVIGIFVTILFKLFLNQPAH